MRTHSFRQPIGYVRRFLRNGHGLRQCEKAGYLSFDAFHLDEDGHEGFTLPVAITSDNVSTFSPTAPRGMRI
jgi:hypothetical protein